jgi:hypothetical protein
MRVVSQSFVNISPLRSRSENFNHKVLFHIRLSASFSLFFPFHNPHHLPRTQSIRRMRCVLMGAMAWKSKELIFVIGVIFIIVAWFSYLRSGNSSSLITIPMENFPEPAWRTSSTLDAITVASTPFARFEVHQVRTESGAIVNDWLWTDERSHVNILVSFLESHELPSFTNTSIRFI